MSTTKEYSQGESLHQLMLSGVETLASNVASTYGPKGRNVIIKKKDSSPVVTKDGVTVARFVNLEDPFQNTAVEIVKQASEKTNSQSGDGTTTSTILAHAIFSKSLDLIQQGLSPVEVKRGLDKICDVVCDEITNMSRPISSLDDISYIAKISSNNDSVIGDLISTAVDKVGKSGSITIEDGRSTQTTLDLMEGFRFGSGYLSSYFITDERRRVVRYDNPLIFMCDAQLDAVQDILPVLEIAARENKPLVIVADDVEGQALAALIMNSVRGSMKVAAIKSPRYGSERKELMADMAVATGGKLFKTMLGQDLKQVVLSDFGTCKTIEISKYNTIIVGGAGDTEEVSQRVEDLGSQIEETDNINDAEFLQERLTKLSSGVAVIRVGAPTEVEMLEKKHRIEDALEAVKSAQQEGIVPGGGVTLFRIANRLDELCSSLGDTDELNFAKEIFKIALSAPIHTIAGNAGLSWEEIVPLINGLDPNCGYNFLTDEVVDMFDAGVIDPCKVTKSALKNAVSAAGTLLTTDHAIVEV